MFQFVAIVDVDAVSERGQNRIGCSCGRLVPSRSPVVVAVVVVVVADICGGCRCSCRRRCSCCCDPRHFFGGCRLLCMLPVVGSATVVVGWVLPLLVLLLGNIVRAQHVPIVDQFFF